MIINLKSKTDFSGFYIVFEGSTNIETKGNRGSTHLLEHLLCRQFKDMRIDLQRSGIDWNATTGNNHMKFYFTGLEEELKKYRKKLVNRILQFDVTKKDFESEKNIVLQEYGTTFNNQYKKHFLNVLRKHFDNCAPIGTKQDLQDLKWMDMIKLYEDHYFKPSKIINVSKNFKFEDSSIDFKDKEINKDWKLAEYNTELEKTKGDKNQSSIIIFTDLENEDIDIMKFISKMLSSGLNAPLYRIAREEKELCYSIDSDVMIMNKQATLMVSTKCEKKNETKLKNTVLNILDNPQKYLTQDRFNTIKTSLKIQEKKRDIDRYMIVDDLIENKEHSLYHRLDKINFKQIKSFYEKLMNKGITTSIDN